MAAERSLIYMFEFVIDDLLITKQNLCAPEEYPTCVEITFRSSVFVNVCDREYGSCVNPNQTKCGKCCIFALESPITDKDRLLIHVYKKRTNRCKFLIGLSELPLKPIFDRVKESFDVENPNWEKIWKEQLQNLPRLKGQNKDVLDNCACYDPGNERREQLCSTSDTTKRLLPLFNLCKQQTGNMVLIMRLVLNGPAIVSTFSLNRPFCSRNPKCPGPCPPCGPCGPCVTCGPCGPCGPCDPCDPCGPCDPCDPCDPCGPCGPCPPPPCPTNPCGGGCGAGNTCATGGPMDKGKKCGGCCPPPPLPQCTMVDPCAKRVEPQKKCIRYFSCNLDKLCPCEYCEDEFDRECPTVPTKRCKSVIEQRLEPCGPCSGVPAYPRYVQEKKAKEQADAKAEKKQQEKEKKKKEGKGGKGRQVGGSCYCDDSELTQQCVDDPCDHCCPEYASCCDFARNRAMRKLRHLLIKYNIQVD